MPAPSTTATTRDPLAQLWSEQVIAVVRTDTIPDPVALCRALAAGGIRTIEFTFTTPDVESCLRAATEQCGQEMTIGAGTVLTADQATAALDTGARFLVTPCLRTEVAAVAADRDVPVLMGALTPGEVLTAHEAGAVAVKIFPAGTVGPKYLSDLHGPFPHLRLVPSGGISAGNAADYLAHGAAAVTAGTSVVTPALVSAGAWDQITARATEFVTRSRTTP